MSTVLKEKRPYLSIKALDKRLGSREVLKNLSLTANKGECIGISGQNGSGKTTLMKVLASVLQADGGELSLGDCTQPFSRAWRAQTSWVPQDIALDPELTVLDNLRFWAALSLQDAASRRAFIENGSKDPLIRSFLKVKAGKLSGGMARRANLAVSLCVTDGLILLDEPFVGADQESSELMEARILELRQNACILLSSHEQGRLERLCTRVERLENGHFSSGAEQ